MEYRWKEGSQHKTSAAVAAEVCKRLEDEGRLTAKDLVDVSRPVSAPLHNEFEWEDSVAAEKYREHQARKVINSIIIVREEHAPIRQFFNIEVRSPEYASVDVLMSKEDTAKRLLRQALQDLQNFQRKYAGLKEYARLKGIISQAIEELESVS